MCDKKSIFPVIGGALGALGGDFLGPELGLSEGVGSGIGGALGSLAGGFGAGASPLGLVEDAAFGGLGGYTLGPSVGGALGIGAPAGTAAAPVGPAAGGGAGGGAAGATSVGGGQGSVTDNLGTLDATGTATEGSGIMDFLKKNPQLALSLGGIALSGLAGGSTPGEAQLKSIAGQVAPVSDLASTVMTGKLPPGAQGLVTNALNDTIASIKSKYASMGITGSTMEAQDIAAAQERASAETFQLASALTTQGLDAAGLAAQIYGAIANIQLTQDQALSQALGGFAQSGGYAAGAKSVV